jgi:hypothetical protein
VKKKLSIQHTVSLPFFKLSRQAVANRAGGYYFVNFYQGLNKVDNKLFNEFVCYRYQDLLEKRGGSEKPYE